MKETCEKCRFWMKTLDLTGSESLGQCRVSRPIISESLLDHEVDGDECGSVCVWAGSVWPITVNTSWCGEWEARTKYLQGGYSPRRDALFSLGLDPRERRMLIALTDHEIDVGWESGFDKLRKIQGIGSSTANKLNAKVRDLINRTEQEMGEEQP